MNSYYKMKQQMTRKFYKFVTDYCYEFLIKNDYQYIIVPITLLSEFHTYLETNTDPIYQEDRGFHFIDPPMKQNFLSFCQTHIHRQEQMLKNYFKYK